MSHLQYAAVGLAVLKRSMGNNPDEPDQNTPEAPNYKLPPLTWGLVFLITLLFVPAFLFTSYSLKSVYTTLAIVENPTPAAYEAVAGDENDAAPAAAPSADEGAADEEAAAQATPPSKPVTASIRRTYKLLRAANGWRGNYRGFWLAVLIFILAAVGTFAVAAIPFVPSFVAALIVALGLVQLQTAWVHTVIRATPSSTPVWRNLPPFRRTFEATSIPTFLQWAAGVVTTLVSVLLTKALDLPQHHSGPSYEVPAYSHDLIWKAIVLFVVALVLVFALSIPANVILVRVQASLLPPDEETVVPFDRSFNGTVEPAVVGGRSYVTIRDAFRTFSRASWKRVYLLYIKLQVLSIIVNVVYLAIVVPLVVLTSSKVEGPN
ncbi:hypothetical protein HMPREF1624_04372 [Sporothrix schenckii ATCC 58251]|uniref:Ubiquitin carrier protein n=1 Tax=Sporothrix schenckii (strain ATCC 58251 / de Perez 2211183) TaxID=1391915 RepID=U7PW62_SPOS1|nr:hypothetical protein HMPREF1624_04372 [Sporothrix schenckii ATCC 58251]